MLNKKKALQDKVIKIREEGKKAFLLFFKFGELEFGVTYEPECFSVQQYMGFHALTKGFEKFTDTGFKSSFVGQGSIASLSEIRQYWINRTSEYGLDLLNPPNILRTSDTDTADVVPVQLTLF